MDNIGTLVVQIKQLATQIEQATQHTPPRTDPEELLHQLIHTAAQAVFVLHRDK